MATHDYIVCVGTRELWVYAADDLVARRVTDRWIRLFWERHKKDLRENHAGSVANAIDNGTAVGSAGRSQY